MTHCLPLSSLHMCPRWIFEVLPPLVSHCLPTSAPVLDGASAFPRSCLAWSSFLFPLLDGMPAFPSCLPLFPMSLTASNCLSLSPHVRVRLPKVLSPLVSLLVSLCWMVRLPPLLWIISHCLPFCFPLLDGVPSRGLVPLVSQLVFVLVSVCWMVRPPSRGFVSPFLSLSPSLSPFLFPFVGWCVRLPPCLPLSPFFFSLCWMVCPPSRVLVPFVS